MQSLKRALYDPDSLKQYKISKPESTLCRLRIDMVGSKKYMLFGHLYFSYVNYNAKNKFGGYTGEQTKIYWFYKNDNGATDIWTTVSYFEDVEITDDVKKAADCPRL